ncbi:Gpr1 family protein [Dendrothele bispora CBS 962.96]|uniref:Gpr1 family protein n=1 Tax=Dendrothele bispora (strain CBS 962.96) TaxID=1314807 RepID=A0A4S8LY37_DENBC|nr:Gpr1 family protein [Dendrothele bispora CBS 962.96]
MSDVEKGTVQATTPSQAFGRGPLGKVGIANPGPLGLFSFASTTLILSLYNVNARNITTPNVVVGMALFCGGLAQFLAGMWEFPKGNTFGATAFTSYGAFWLSYATILIPGSGIGAAYGTETEELDNAIGIYLMTWMTVTFLLFIVSLRKSASFIGLFGFLTLTFMCLGAGEFTGNANLGKAGGALGIITALIAYYIGLSEMLAAERAAVVQLPLFAFKHD